jgi:hypothetical protein
MAFQNTITTLASGSAADGWQQGTLAVVKEWLESIFGEYGVDNLADVYAYVTPDAEQIEDISLPWIEFYHLPSVSRSKGGNTRGKQFNRVVIAIEINAWRQSTKRPDYVGKMGLQRLGDMLRNGYVDSYGDFGTAGFRKPRLDGGGFEAHESSMVSRWLLIGEVEEF